MYGSVYRKKPDGLIQNDDHGQGSRWLVEFLLCKNIEIHKKYTFNKFSDLINFEKEIIKRSPFY